MADNGDFMSRGARARGFACVGLQQPKNESNVGGVMRASYLFGVSLVVLSGKRYKYQASDTYKTQRHLPIIHNAANLFDHIPVDCIPVAIELVDGATPLPEYEHPQRAFYIFGPEDGSINAEAIARCRDRVAIPSTEGRCSNLCAAVNIVLYDRMAKQIRNRDQ